MALCWGEESFHDDESRAGFGCNGISSLYLCDEKAGMPLGTNFMLSPALFGSVHDYLNFSNNFG